MFVSWLSTWFLSLLVTLSLSTDPECPYAPLEPQPWNASSLRLVQYNAEWLFTDYYAPMNCPGSGCTWITLDAAQEHLQRVCSVLSSWDADLIHLVEVEGCDELVQLVDCLQNSKFKVDEQNQKPKYQTLLKRGTDSSTGQNVALLSRLDPWTSLYRNESRMSYPLPSTNSSSCSSLYHGSNGTTGVSKHFITQFQWNDISITLIGVHLLAYPTDINRCVQREAQATLVAEWIQVAIQQGNEVIVIGDLNDFDPTIPDRNNNQPLSQVLSILKGSSMNQLWSVADRISLAKDRYTDWWDSDNNCNTRSESDWSMIDHILVTPWLYQHIQSVYMDHSYDEFCGTMNSDHYPIIVDFVFV